MTTSISLLVVAKAPVVGQVKTRLAATVGATHAAELAAASLLDTIEVCRATFGVARCHLALAGELAAATRGDEIRRAVAGWRIRPQHGAGLAERLAHAHAAMAGPALQIGMDTPQVTRALLEEAADGLASHDAVLGPALDGGWWALGVRDPSYGAALVRVPMSTSETYEATRAALRATGLDVATCRPLRDVDDAADADAVAGEAPSSRFARAWTGVTAR